MVQVTDYTASVQQGLEHVAQHQRALADEVGFFLDVIATGEGNREFCMLRLCSYATANAMLSWFKDHDLHSFKQWSYVSARLEQMLFRANAKRWYPAHLLLMPLLSDQEKLIDWFASNDVPFDLTRANDPSTADFHGYQALLALRGEWRTLEERCIKVIGHSIKKMKKYEIDHQFYLALARHDVVGMEKILEELTSPKIAKIRNIEQAFGFTGKLISTHAVVYAKIAWRHGFELLINTPWIPKEWLPIFPLEDYEDPYVFMKNFNI
jgi:hypothetical protein